jgi:hypothetical protein
MSVVIVGGIKNQQELSLRRVNFIIKTVIVEIIV